MRHILVAASAFAVLAAAVLAPTTAAAQGAQLIAVGDPAYVLIERLQRRGRLLELPPTALPYSVESVQAAMAVLDTVALSVHEERWLGHLHKRLPRRFETQAEEGLFDIGHEWSIGSSATNGRRLDPMRPIAADSSSLQVGSVSVYPNSSLHLWMGRGPFVAQAGLRFDAEYNDDPDGLDVVKRLWVRNEDAYLGVAVSGFSAYAGRYGVSWAPPGADGLLLSENPRAFDRVSYAFGGPRFTVRGEAGELDSATENGGFSGRAGDSFNGDTAIDRFLVAHRFDWRPVPALLVSIQESAIYSGANAGWSPLFVVPSFIQFFGIDNTPKNVEHNGFAAGQIWAQVHGVTAQGQLMLDDFDVLNASEPTSFALAGTISAADVLPAVDVIGALTAVSARTYNTSARPGIYVYALRGIATPFSDFVHARLGADVYVDGFVSGLTVSPSVQVLWQGEASFLDSYPDNELPTILVGTTESTIRAGALFRWEPSPWTWASADLGMNRTTNDEHVSGADRMRFVGQVEFGARIRFGGPVRL